VRDPGRKIRILWGRACRKLHLPTRSLASSGLALGTWVRDLRRTALPPVRGHRVLVGLQTKTWIEWALYAACWFRRLGYASTLVYSAREVRELYGDESGRQTFVQRFFYEDFWKNLRAIPNLELADLDQEPAPEETGAGAYADFARDYAPSVSAYALCVEENEEGPLRPEYLRRVEQDERRLREAGATLERLFRRLGHRHGAGRVVTFSGLIGLTPAVFEAARRLGWDVAAAETYGIKPGMMLCNVNGHALDYRQRDWIRALSRTDERWTSQMEEFLAYQESGQGDLSDITDSEWLRNLRQYQPSSARQGLPEAVERLLGEPKPTFLLAPNVVGDSATLRRATIFRSQRDWIGRTCAFFREHPEMNLIIRAHPGELLMSETLRLRMGPIAQEAAEGAPNIRVIGSHEKISTYALVPRVRGGLVWVSNVGVDMVARGCPVVMAAKAHWRGVGLACEPAGAEEYFGAILGLARAPQPPSAEQKKLAMMCLAIVWKEIAYPGFGPLYLGEDMPLSGPGVPPDCRTFYEVLAGDRPMKTVEQAVPDQPAKAGPPRTEHDGCP
jgi:hypothetical protein